MKKTERQNLIKKALVDGGFKFKALNETLAGWAHVRVEGFGDIWPSTGTYRIGKKFYKRDFNGLYERLTGKLTHNSHNQRKCEIERLNTIINELLKRVEDLEIEVYSPAGLKSNKRSK